MQGVRIEPVSVAGCRGQELQAHNGTETFKGHLGWRFVPKPCLFCGNTATLTNAHVLSQPIRSALIDPSVTSSLVYRQSRQADGSNAAHSHSGSWVDVKARAECARCNGGWTRQIEESVSGMLPRLIKGELMQLSAVDQQALASWAVVTVLLLQHTHNAPPGLSSRPAIMPTCTKPSRPPR
jgi:hypothetical protein